MDTNKLELQIFVEPGKVTQNFAEFKQMVKRELETKYMNISVTEENLKDAKDARARLNKAMSSLKESMRSAQRQNDEPLKVPKAQAKELEALLNDAIIIIDTQIKRIEDKRREEKHSKALGVYREVFANAPEDVREFADRCEWIIKDEWSNATYSLAKVKSECISAVTEIDSALQLLTGEYSAQMLEDFRQYGSIAKAQIEGQRLAKAKEEFKHLSRQNLKKAREYPTPEFYISTEEDLRVGSMDIRFIGRLHQLKWLRDLCKDEGIKVENLRKNNKEN